MVSPSLFLPQEHLSKDSQSTSTQLIAINKSSIGAIPLECNSFIIDNRKLKFDFEILSFQMITVFYFERLSIYNYREVSEDIFSNYNYIKLLFIVVFAAVFIFLTFRSKNKFLKVYRLTQEKSTNVRFLFVLFSITTILFFIMLR